MTTKFRPCIRYQSNEPLLVNAALVRFAKPNPSGDGSLLFFGKEDGDDYIHINIDFKNLRDWLWS